MSFKAGTFLNTDSGPPGLGVYCYVSPDPRVMIIVPGYINNIRDAQNLAVGDMMHVMGSNGGYSLEVLSISPSGDITFDDHSSVLHGNTENTLYLKGDAITNGSIRFIVNPVDSSFCLENRIANVWKDSRFLFGNASGVVTEHTIYTNNLEPVLDNFMHPIYANQS